MFNEVSTADRTHPPFDFAVLDEAQDVNPMQLRFLAALGAGKSNCLFFTGDTGQRIFQQPFSWKSLGVDIRGRSRTLKINYRTSHQIRTQAGALLVTRTRWFRRYWKALALVQVGLLDVTGAIMNIFSGTVTPHFYTIITFSIGCATFLPWGVIWQSVLNLFCLGSYVLVSLHATVAERFLYYQWITLLAVLILSEFPAAFIDRYRRRLFRQLEN
jgi:hypothetical protein